LSEQPGRARYERQKCAARRAPKKFAAASSGFSQNAHGMIPKTDFAIASATAAPSATPELRNSNRFLLLPFGNSVGGK
jgi:hypothetical protein